MSKEKFIKGKTDYGHHDGKASNLRRKQEAIYQEEHWEEVLLDADSCTLLTDGVSLRRMRTEKSYQHQGNRPTKT